MVPALHAVAQSHRGHAAVFIAVPRDHSAGIGIVKQHAARQRDLANVFAEALKAEPEKQNEVSGLMIMGLFGGTIFPLFMGFASQAVGTIGAVLVMAIGAIYLTCYTLKIKK